MTETFLLPTGIDPKMFRHSKEAGVHFREKLEDLFPQIKGKRLLLFAGRVVKEKNLGFLFDILLYILAKHPDAVLLIAGDGPDQDYYKTKANNARLTESCVFTGYMERKDLALTYAISDVFVFPSMTDTQGLVPLEAMLSGTPVVAIGALGTLMVMGGDNGGFMVKNDKEEFAARVLELLGNPELHRKKSLEAKAHARSWSIDEMTKKLVEIYQSTIDSYKEDYGEARTPVWGLLMDKKWWKVNNQNFQKKTKQKLQQVRARLKRE
jgi:glycosyltransferase involved in cell wall biosynthesis